MISSRYVKWRRHGNALFRVPPCLSGQRSQVFYNRISKNKPLLKKHRDAAFEDLLDSEKRPGLLRRVVRMLGKQPLGRMDLFRFACRGRSMGLRKPQTMTALLDRYPGFLETFRDDSDGQSHVRASRDVLRVVEEEARIREEEMASSGAARRLRKLLMMCPRRRARIDRLEFLAQDFGMPDNSLPRLAETYPEYFCIETPDPWSPFIALAPGPSSWDPSLAIPIVDSYRKEKATLEKGLLKLMTYAYSFPVDYPPGFVKKKGFRTNETAWQELPYIGPYAEFHNDGNPDPSKELGPRKPSRQDLPYCEFRSDGNLDPALALPAKRAISIIHEPEEETRTREVARQELPYLGPDTELQKDRNFYPIKEMGAEKMPKQDLPYQEFGNGGSLGLDKETGTRKTPQQALPYHKFGNDGNIDPNKEMRPRKALRQDLPHHEFGNDGSLELNKEMGTRKKPQQDDLPHHEFANDRSLGPNKETRPRKAPRRQDLPHHELRNDENLGPISGIGAIIHNKPKNEMRARKAADGHDPSTEKRAISIIHEFLHLTIEKRTTVGCLGRLQEDLMLPQRVSPLVLRHPGMFYLSTKGADHTIFLREAYHKGRLLERHALSCVKDKFIKLMNVRRSCSESDER